jgi:hypothetical protein
VPGNNQPNAAGEGDRIDPDPANRIVRSRRCHGGKACPLLSNRESRGIARLG